MGRYHQRHVQTNPLVPNGHKKTTHILDAKIRREFLTIHDDEYELGPLFKSIAINPNQIHIVPEYHWIFTEDELRELKSSRADEWLYCPQSMKHGSTVTFRIGVCRKANNKEQTGFQIKIEKSSEALLNGSFSVMVDEIEYSERDDTQIRNLNEGDRRSRVLFNDNLMDSLSSLSIHISVHFR